MLPMALATKAALVLLVLGSAGLAHLGPPPRRCAGVGVRGALLGVAGFGCACGAAALVLGALVPGALALVLAGELMCAAGWLGRGEPPADGGDDDEGGGGGGGRRPKPPPWDWDAFEASFRRYARERERARV